MTPNPPDKRRRILDAAVTVFAQNGFYNAKVSQIAKEAGVADGTIYLYFKNKEDILIQVFIDSMDEILRRQEDAVGLIEDPVERLVIFTRVHFESVAESRALAEVITVELRQSSKFMRNTDMKPFGRYLGIIRRIVDDGSRTGTFAPALDSRIIARAIFGAIDELALEWAMGNRGTSLEDACAQVTDLFLSGLLRRPS
ncbi:MAG: TetR/AcrR family transcriptional regulator [Deltaproteobacteria bacterium]|nr:TetR/AcrR family transcriptional regulator [Deltaproteobacteria bacterium]